MRSFDFPRNYFLQLTLREDSMGSPGFHGVRVISFLIRHLAGQAFDAHTDIPLAGVDRLIAAPTGVIPDVPISISKR